MSDQKTQGKSDQAEESAPVSEEQAESLQRALWLAQAAIDKKGENIKVMDLSEVSGFTDYFIICSGTSDRQVHAITDAMESRLRTEGEKPLSIEGYSEGRWVVLDYGDVVAHIFLDAIREYYDLESLWADCPRVQIPEEFYSPAATRLN